MHIHHTQVPNPKKERIFQIPRGSLTIEAAFALPIFLYAIICLVLLLEIHAIQVRMQQAVTYAAINSAHDYAIVPIPYPVRLHSEIINHMGEELLDRSLIQDGASGVNSLFSYVNPKNDEVHANVSYRIQLPIPFYEHLTVKRKVSAHVKAWTGLDVERLEAEDLDMVYITDTGIVYHESASCTHLQLSIRYINASQLSSERNIDGSIYKRCERCGVGGYQGGVYVTGWGTRYHSSLSCSGLKRTIQVIPRSKIGIRGGCSRCSSS